MKKLFSLAIALAAAVALLATICTSSPPSAHAIGGGPNGYYYITHVLNGGLEYDPEVDFVLGPGTAASIAKNWTVSTSWGANVGVSRGVVSAGLSFTVGISWGVSETCSATNTTNHDRTLQWQTVYIDWYYDVYWHSYNNGANSYQGSGWAKEFDFNRCAFY